MGSVTMNFLLIGFFCGGGMRHSAERSDRQPD